MTVDIRQPRPGEKRGGKERTTAYSVTPIAVEGQRFDFITAHGERREYVVASAEDSSDVLGLAARVKLRNLAGGGMAWVTIKWLIDPEGPSGARWEAVEA